MLRFVVLAIAFLAVCSALPQRKVLSKGAIVVSPQEPATRKGWRNLGRAKGDEQVNIVVGLKHRNMDKIRSLWWDIANPKSATYGKFLTNEQISEISSPDSNAVHAVTSWLNSHGASKLDVSNPPSFVTAQLPASSVEKMLSVLLHQFAPEDSLAHAALRTTDRVRVPEFLQEYVDIISGVSDFSRPWHEVRRARRMQHARTSRSGHHVNDDGTIAPAIQFLNNGNHEIEIVAIPLCTYVDVQGNTCNTTSYKNEIAGFVVELASSSGSNTFHFGTDDIMCDIYTDSGTDWIQDCSLPVQNVSNWVDYNVSVATIFKNGQTSDKTYSPATVVCGMWALPHIIKQLYNVTDFATGDTGSKSTAGVILFEYQFYSPTDLVTFLNATNLPHDPAAVVAPTDPNDPTNPGDEGQADIELESANGVGSASSTFWYSGNRPDGVLQWALQIANVSDADVPKVWSLSWGISETQFDQDVGEGIQERINDELTRMGIRGITVVVASGDAGLRDVGRSEFTCGAFEPSFPASSPYVVTASATMLVGAKDAQTAIGLQQTPSSSDLPICSMHMDGTGAGEVLSCDESGLDQAVEVAVACCTYGAVWTTGGGFSNNYTRATWQAAAVQGYVASQQNLPPSNFWNVSGRAYPDISVVGDKVPTVLFGSVNNFGGTSASAPITAGLISLLNAARVSQGKSLLGPVGPVLYQLAKDHPTAFRDITIGDNRCGELECCDEGFDCAVGWDPVTGLGTPNIGVLRDLVLALP